MRGCWFIALLLPSFLGALPPPLPSAGVIEREIETEYEGKPLEMQKEMPSFEVEIPEERLDLPEGATVFVKSVRIEGNQVIADKKIQRWIQSFLNRKLSISEIYQMCKLIDGQYAQCGYFLARAYPPPQEIHDGVLVIRVLEGKIGTIRIEGNRCYRTKFIRKYFEPFCNKTLKYEEFLKALLLLNENADLTAGVVFEKGREVGTADLIVRVDDNWPVHLYLNENNYGRDLTTNTQFGGRLDFSNFLFYGDTFSLAEVVGFPIKALYFTDATYTVPLNAKGTFMEFSYLFSKFHIEELTSLHLRGESVIGTIKAKQAVMRTKTVGLDLFSYFDIKQIQNYVLGSRVSFDKLRVLTGGFLFDHYNSAQGRDYLNCRVGGGIPNFLGGMSAVSSESSRAGGGGGFLQINLDYDRIQRIYKEWLLYLHFSGQWSPSKLTLPQQIYIGGSNTVRGYPLSVALGDSGYYANFETRIPCPFFRDWKFIWTKRPLKEAIQFVGFVDTGGTIFNEGSRTFITGIGGGVRVLGPFSLALSFDIGVPLNHQELSEGSFYYLKVTAQPF